ncbi:pentatricopeptide repeat-containing protein [Dorcoceras hygrometricum]|uniref:Pentatricopeptide repeat-containing protein n=1 Tax=Dorcoceras hygrometricum TaxID=472368 RepID=A0A2Z7BI10_9LAMI|nr:pentatricopeptide repeat-containing protein [Dorcoceras hygrometricum]
MKVLSATSRPIQRSSGRQYSTRSSSHLVYNFSNIDDDPVDLISSSPASGDGGDGDDGDNGITLPDSPVVNEDVPVGAHFIQEQDAGLASGTDPPRIPVVVFFSHVGISLGLLGCHPMFCFVSLTIYLISSIVLPLRISPHAVQGSNGLRAWIYVDLSFSDAGTSTSSQLVRCIPSMESISFAKAVVHNFLKLGLHQLGESQRLAMISAISILRASPKFISEYPLLDSVATIFSDSDMAQALSM